MTALQVRLAWLEAISQKLRRFMEQGGDLRSAEPAFLAVLVFRATADLVRTPSVQGTVREAMRLAPVLPMGGQAGYKFFPYCGSAGVQVVVVPRAL